MTLISTQPSSQSIVLDNISWAEYVQRLSEVENGGTRLTYYHGRLEIMTVSGEQEDAKTTLGRLIEAYADAHDQDIHGYGSTTYRSQAMECGLEPDECYYVAGAESVARKRPTRKGLDTKADPPPDLAIEVKISRSSIPKQPIYAALGIAEVWRYDGERVIFLRLDGDAYTSMSRSISFPNFPLERVNEFLAIGLAGKQSDAVRALRKWIASGEPAPA